MWDFETSVILNKDKCKGCTTCLKNCPTQAIRIRNGKARIITEKCIDCGECIRVCPHGAKNALSLPIDKIHEYKYKVAMPAPTLVSQFNDKLGVNKILNGLLKIGFDDVIEVAYGAEIIGKALKYEFEKDYNKPIISSACPAVVRLIQVKFPELTKNIIKLESPMEITARLKRNELIKKGYKDEEIGIFFITPCAAKITSIKYPVGSADNKSAVTDAISIKDVYSEIVKNVKKIDKEIPLSKASMKGVNWARSGGESTFLEKKNYLNVDEIANVYKVLEEIERGKLSDIEFFEGLACIGGCVGGCLTVENSFIARRRIRKMYSENKNEEKVSDKFVKKLYKNNVINRDGEILPRPSKPLDLDFNLAIEKMAKMEEIEESLPGLDCGSCGAPDCVTLAEDIVRGEASEVDCIFILKQKLNDLSKLMVDLSDKVVPTIVNLEKGDKKNDN